MGGVELEVESFNEYCELPPTNEPISELRRFMKFILKKKQNKTITNNHRNLFKDSDLFHFRLQFSGGSQIVLEQQLRFIGGH